MNWGTLAIINLYNCNPKKIRSKKEIKSFIAKLCRVIEMRKFSKTRVRRFGQEKLRGYSAMQFIESSSITIHFDEEKNRAFIDIFSCKNFDGRKAEKFSGQFFNAKTSSLKTIKRA